MSRKLSSMRLLGSLALCVSTAAAAQAAGPINVTALPLASCPSGTANANGTDTIDDTPAFKCAISLVPAADSLVPETDIRAGEIYIPAGTYHLSERLVIQDRSIAFRGEGQRISILFWTTLTAGHNGVDFSSTSTNRHRTLAVRSLSLLRGEVAGGAAIHAAWANLSAPSPVSYMSGGGVTATIEDVHISAQPWNENGPHWHRGIWLENAISPNIHTFNIQGYKATAPSEQSAGVAAIHLAGSGAGGRTVGASIHHGSILGYIRGIYATEGNEGLRARNVIIRDAYWGFELIGIGHGTSITNSQIFARSHGIKLYNSEGDMAIANNLIYRDKEDQFIGIELNRNDGGECVRMRIIGNAIFAYGGGNFRYGIMLANQVKNSVVEGNTTHNMDIGIWLASSTVANNIVLANINRTLGTQLTNSGVNNTVANNW